MKHFLKNGELYAFEDDGSQDEWITSDMQPLTSEEVDAIRNPPETAEQTIAKLEKALDSHLDTIAQSYRYESIRTMVTYATSDHPTFGPEGRAAVKFRDAVYAHGIAKIAACTREVDPEPIPTEAELIAELPDIQDFFE